jgi:hypothetical protein
MVFKIRDSRYIKNKDVPDETYLTDIHLESRTNNNSTKTQKQGFIQKTEAFF